ncbi:MAG: nucleotide exchange factor GrpE [Deltaproteobacteria bacterium]|nr:nucleotide exchange factor GrpE [Deltaproteobacteria bacterium]MBI3295496.1 nucleotide exchange factor GrpE [Deltaproteobacteria bacterium]
MKESKTESKGNGEELKNNSESELVEEAAPLSDEEGSAVAAEDAGESAKKELLYMRAEFDNYRKRMIRDQEQMVRFANEKLIRELLTIVDLFDRALEHAEKVKGEGTPSVKTFVDGIEMTSRELGQLLIRFGVEFVGSIGDRFDPAKHEAISEVLGGEPGKVVAVLNRGCNLNGRLLRPAKVVVSKQNG